LAVLKFVEIREFFTILKISEMHILEQWQPQ